MANNKKKSFLEYYIESKKLNKDIKNLEKGIDRETKENKENNVNAWDLLDTQTGARKVLPGPSMTELQESQLKKIMDPDYKRPISHTIKDSVATVGPAAVSAATKVVSKPLTKAISNSATKSTVNTILDKISKGIGKIANYNMGAKLGSDDVVELAKKADAASHKSLAADAEVASKTVTKKAQDAMADHMLESIPEKEWPGYMNKPYIYDKDIEKLKDAAKLAKYQKDYATGDLTFALYDILKDEFGDVKGIVANADKTYDLESMADLFELAFQKPDKLRSILDDWSTMEKLSKEAPDIQNLTDLYKAHSDELWGNANKNLKKKLNIEEVESFSDFMTQLARDQKYFKEHGEFPQVNPFALIHKDIAEESIKKGRTLSNKEKARVQNALLKAAKKRYKGHSLFEKIMNPKDPIYKSLVEKSDEILDANAGLIEYMHKGDSFEEAIRNSLLDYVFDKADDNYRAALYEISKGTEYPDFDRLLKEHPFRNPDGSIKSEADIIKSISNDPFYEKLVNEFMENTLKMPARNELLSKVKSTELSSIPLLANYVTRTAKNSGVNKYDPFNKKSIDALPPELQPWNPDIESTYTDRFWENIGNVLGVNWSGDPNRFTKSQLKMVRQALVDVAKETGFENPNQIEALSSSEVLTLLRKVGNGKYGEDIMKKVSSVANNMIDSQKESREQKLADKQKQLKNLEDSQNKKGD